MPSPHKGDAACRVMLQMGQGSGLDIDKVNGVIRNVAVITSGVTKPSAGGNDPFYVDQVALQQVADAINQSEVGVKSRLTHPEIDGLDDIGCRLGYIRNARVVGNVVRADMHFHSAVDMNAIRLMDIASQDPGSCGLSIIDSGPSFEPLEGVPTGIVLRVSGINAVDWVGSPAANPAGMLSTVTALWNPSKHPRDGEGEFADKGGGGSSSGKRTSSVKNVARKISNHPATRDFADRVARGQGVKHATIEAAAEHARRKARSAVESSITRLKYAAARKLGG